MHARTSPIEEARQLYLEQADLARRLQLRPGEDAADSAPLVVWDVGLGAAANAMAAIHCYEEQAVVGALRPLRLISFENDLDSLKLALARNDVFTYLRHGAAAGILRDGEWRSKRHPALECLLAPGDFQQTMSKAPAAPDLIFYDLFSSNSDARSWTLEAFQRLFAVCAPRATELFTYSFSTAARAALLVAGFHVAKGRNAGAVPETTIALTPAALERGVAPQRELLSLDWLEKWNRSTARYASDITPEEYPSFAAKVRGHPQFAHALPGEERKNGSGGV